MKKFSIGFTNKIKEDYENDAVLDVCTKEVQPKKSIVYVYFPHRVTGWAYYNDSFDLKVGDWVYVEGKLEGYRGRITEINYSFKIKASEYKRVIAVVDTTVNGDLYMAMSHLVSFDKNVIPYDKILSWFKAPENDDEYIYGDDNTDSFLLDDLSTMNIPSHIAERGHNYYTENKVVYIELSDTYGRAIVEGSDNYEVLFNFTDGEISDIKCTCFCSGRCKHELAAMLQLRETLDFILKNYEAEYNGYFAAISKEVLLGISMNKNGSGKISLEV